MSLNDCRNRVSHASMALGAGLIAGLAGTAAATLTKKLDKHCNNERSSEKAILEVASKVLDIKPSTEEKKDKVLEEVHWIHGSAMGAVRGMLSLWGIRGLAGTAMHLGVLWYVEKMLLPDAKKVFPYVEAGKSILEEKRETMVRECAHQAVYALVTGIIFDFIVPKKSHGLDSRVMDSNHQNRL